MAKKNILSDEQKIILINKYLEGNSIRELQKITGLCRQTISKILKNENIKIRDNSINSRKYFCNEDYFEEIDTEHKAYWLGFIYADGYIVSKKNNYSQKIGITLNSKDENHIKKFKNDINATNPIKRYIGSGYNPNGEFSKILITSQKLVDDLKTKGVIENKTKIITFPTEDIVPKELIPHFIRGYLDGDGCICFNKYVSNKCQINFTGTYEFLYGINLFFQKNNVITSHNGAYELKYSGTNEAFRILNILYENATIFLDRKYIKVKDFVNNMVKTRV